jgi:hypothetical protein
MWDTLGVILLAIVTFILSELLGLFLQLNNLLIIALSLGFALLLFRVLRGKVVHSCIARLSETSVQFDFTDEIKVINFSDLISYKDYNGKNGPILYLNTQTDNFKIFANNNFCKTDDFKMFCDDTIIQLDKYKDTNNLALSHEGSIFTKKGMLYFLIIATSVYLFGFLFETKALRIAIGICGGFYFFIMWTKYYIESKKQKE